MKTIELLQAEIHKLQAQIKDKEAQQNSIECDPDDLADQFDECLDEAGSIEVAGFTFYPSHILSRCDPIGYRQGLIDFADSYFNKEESKKFRDLQEEIDQLESDIEDLESEIEDLENQIEEIEENTK